MMKQFYEDLEKSKFAEVLVKETFEAMTDKYIFEDVSNIPYYYHKGDIKATAASGKEIMIEVKADSCIHSTSNVLLEDESYFEDTDEWRLGNVHSFYEIYVVVSAAERKMYVMDFSILKQHYKEGEFKVIEHGYQTNYVYLLPLCRVRQWGGMIAEVNY